MLTGALRETRTPDPLITNQMLYRLSYEGIEDAIGSVRRRCNIPKTVLSD